MRESASFLDVSEGVSLQCQVQPVNQVRKGIVVHGNKCIVHVLRKCIAIQTQWTSFLEFWITTQTDYCKVFFTTAQVWTQCSIPRPDKYSMHMRDRRTVHRYCMITT